MSDPAAHHDTSAAPGVEVVKWYTRARRFPQLIGRTSDGTRLPGGPYTYTQVGLGVGVLLVGQKTARLWAHFGTATNVVVLVGITAAVVFFAGRLPIGGRNPLSLASGAVQAFTAPRHGRYKGVPVRAGKPHRVNSARLVVLAPATPAPLVEVSRPGVDEMESRQAMGQLAPGAQQTSLDELLGDEQHGPARSPERAGAWTLHLPGRGRRGATAAPAPSSLSAPSASSAGPGRAAADRGPGSGPSMSPAQPAVQPSGAGGAPLTGVQRLLAQSHQSTTAVKDHR